MILAALLLQVPIPPVLHCGPGPNCAGTHTGRYFGEHTLCVATTNHRECYWIDGPNLDGTPKPMVVVFHEFGGDHSSAPQNADFWDEAIADGNIVVSHDCGWDNWSTNGHKTHGSEEFHAATRAVMADVLAQFPNDVDRDRVYAYGFSMGGGNALNYAARHQDPTATDDVMFAAVANHSGAVSVPLGYFGDTSCSTWPQNCTGSGGQAFFDNLYGATYCALPSAFPFQRATLLDWPDGGLDVIPWTSLAQNLRRMPMKTWWDDDPFGACTLPMGNQKLLSFVSHPGVYLGNQHGWNQLDPAEVLDFFRNKTLSGAIANAPSGYAMFAEDHVRHYFFEGVRASSSDFGRVGWWFAGGNRVNLVTPAGGSNLSRVIVVLDSWTPLSTASCLEVHHQDAFQLTLRGYARKPSAVYLGTQQMFEGTDWNYSGGEVNIVNTSMGLWRIAPNNGNCP